MYSMAIFVVDYDSYHCLLLMLYVSGLATVDFVGGLCCYAFHAITNCSYYVTFCGFHGLFFLLLIYIP